MINKNILFFFPYLNIRWHRNSFLIFLFAFFHLKHIKIINTINDKRNNTHLLSYIKIFIYEIFKVILNNNKNKDRYY